MQPESEEILAHDTSICQNQSTNNNLFKTISIIASHFINADTLKSDQLLANSIRMLSRSIHSGRGYLCRITHVHDNPECTGLWIGDEEISADSVLPDLKHDLRIKSVIEKKEILLINIEKCKQIMQDRNFEYNTENSPLIYIPIVKNNTAIGVICFENFLIPPRIDKPTLQAFRIAAVMFANMLCRISVDNKPVSEHARLITYIKNMEQENKKLKEINTLKSEFVSVISHELRTPLTGIIGLTQTLRLTDLSLSELESDHYLGIIESEGKRLARLIKDLSDMSLLESGNLRLSSSYFDITTLINEVITLVGNTGIFQYATKSSEMKSVWLDADRDRIKQVLIILFDNALKHGGNRTPVGISITKNERTITTGISDQGPGIIPEEKERIFDKYYRLRSPDNHRNSGSGLGLAIAKQIIDAHGGKIWVESEPGNGSTFLFTLNLSSPSS